MRYLRAQNSGKNLTNDAHIALFYAHMGECTTHYSNPYTRYLYETQKNYIR